LRQAEAGKVDCALLNARMALHNQPLHLGAQKLKESLLGQREYESEGARMRTFALDLLRAERQPVASQPAIFDRPLLEDELRVNPEPTTTGADAP
jgi:hypothetical protein